MNNICIICVFYTHIIIFNFLNPNINLYLRSLYNGVQKLPTNKKLFEKFINFFYKIFSFEKSEKFFIYICILYPCIFMNNIFKIYYSTHGLSS